MFNYFFCSICCCYPKCNLDMSTTYVQDGGLVCHSRLQRGEGMRGDICDYKELHVVRSASEILVECIVIVCDSRVADNK
jgi:hypothetical protein